MSLVFAGMMIGAGSAFWAGFAIGQNSAMNKLKKLVGKETPS